MLFGIWEKETFVGFWNKDFSYSALSTFNSKDTKSKPVSKWSLKKYD